MTEIQHVSDTAFLVAHHRAVESARKDALFADPLAERLAGSRGRELAASMPTSAMTGWTVAIRTRIIDDFIREGVARGVDMVINLGAGLDTRPYRLTLPSSLSWVEVDYPEVVSFKESQLASETPTCRLERVGLDLARAEDRRALLARLDRRAARILVVTEGVVPYLDVGGAGLLADDLRGLSHIDGWIVDYISPETHAYRRKRGLDRLMQAAPFKFQPPDWTAFFAEHRWQSAEMRYLGVEGRRYGRRPPLPWAVRAITRISRLLAPAEARERLQRFAGYALLVPTP